MNKGDKLRVSSLTLGTVQLGMPYGVANQTGQPDQENSYDMLGTALSLEVNTFDTSRYYGNSEEVIGHFLRGYKDAPRPLIVSKFKWSKAALTDSELARKEAKDTVKESLARLGLGVMPVLLYHKGQEQPIDLVMKRLPDVLSELISEGYIQHGGISLYYPDEASAIYEEEQIEAVQVPFNVLDQRLTNMQAMRRFDDAGKTVFVRSVFLQGLFFMDPALLPSGLRDAAPYLQQLRSFATNADMDVAQLAVSFVRDTIGVSSLIFGADNADQVRQNVGLLNGKRLPESLRAQLHDFFRDMPEKIITPGYW